MCEVAQNLNCVTLQQDYTLPSWLRPDVVNNVPFETQLVHEF